MKKFIVLLLVTNSVLGIWIPTELNYRNGLYGSMKDNGGLIGNFIANNNKDNCPVYGNKVVLSRDGKNIIITSLKYDNLGQVGSLVFLFKIDDSLNIDYTGTTSPSSYNKTSGALNEDGTVLIAGEPYPYYNDPAITSYFGSASVYENGLTANDVTLTVNGETSSDTTGFSVAVNSIGDTIAIGEPGWENNFDYGRVRVFRKNNNVWSIIGNALGIRGESPNGLAVGTACGYSISLNKDGNILAVGEHDFANNLKYGRVRVFKYNQATNNFDLYGGDVNKTSPLGINGQYPNTEIGHDVALNDDGNILIVGGPGNNSNQGIVRIYKYNPGTDSWDQLGQDLEGVAQGDNFGNSVAINSDGSIIAVGSPGWSKGSGEVDNGKVYVYRLSNNQWENIITFEGENGNKAGYSVSLDSLGTRVAFSEIGYDKYAFSTFKIYGRTKVFDIKKKNLFFASYFFTEVAPTIIVDETATVFINYLALLRSSPLDLSKSYSPGSKWGDKI